MSETDVTLKFTPEAFNAMQETFKKHKEFIHKFHPLIQASMLEDINKIQSILSTAERKGKK